MTSISGSNESALINGLKDLAVNTSLNDDEGIDMSVKPSAKALGKRKVVDVDSDRKWAHL